MLTLLRPLAVFDTETTGVDPVRDRLVEFGITVYHPDGTRKQWEQRFNPGIPIPKEASDIHGITDEHVKDCPPFSAFSLQIYKGLRGKDIAGYNVRRLDLPLLDEELRRCGLKLDIVGAQIVDAAGIFFNKEKRNLEAAVLKYCGRSHDGAHGAGADADATLDVFLAQLATYHDLAAMNLADIAAFSRLGDKDYVDLAGKLYRDEDGDLRYAFGKPKDIKVKDDPGFGYWMLGKDFAGHTVEVLRAEFERCGL